MTGQNRQPKGVPAGGQFAASVWPESSVSLDGAHHDADPREEYRVIDGECSNCGHYDDHEFCEYCSPSCSECGTELDSADLDMCDSCREREEEYDDEDEEPWA